MKDQSAASDPYIVNVQRQQVIREAKSDEASIENLMAAGAYSAAAGHAHQLISDGNLPPHRVLALRLCQALAYVGMRQPSKAVPIMNLVGDLHSPSLCYESFPDIYPTQQGSFVPFTFRLIKAELPWMVGSTSQSIDLLTQLDAWCEKQSASCEEGSQDRSLWKRRRVRTKLALAGVFARDGAAYTACELLDDAYAIIPSPMIQSLKARIYMDCGYLDGAQIAMAKAKEGLENIPAHVHMDEGLFAYCMEDYESAAKRFLQAYKEDPKGSGSVNNRCVSLVYDKEVTAAMLAMQNHVYHETETLRAPFVTNYCTLLDLTKVSAKADKIALRDHCAKLRGDEFDLTAIHLTKE